MDQTKSPVVSAVVSPQYAYDFLAQASHALLIDVRSSMEYLFVGHPVGAIHIAWIDDPDWDINVNFAAEVQQTAQKKAANDVKQNPHFFNLSQWGTHQRSA